MSHGNKQKHESKNPIQRALIGRFKQRAAELVRRAAPRTILDLGCGEGFMIEALLDAGIDAQFTGIDLSETAIADAKARIGARADLTSRPFRPEFEVIDARQLVDDGRTFDMVMMLEVLEHIPDPAQMMPILQKLARQHVLLSVPWEPFFCGLNLLRGKNITRLGNDPEHVNHWTRHGFFRFLRPHFDILGTPGVFPWSMALATPKRPD
jgi:2-polyprenyl-3-methyl-5-hydroxy-6-metoxy-1,4-benzoquinol methylase